MKPKLVVFILVIVIVGFVCCSNPCSLAESLDITSGVSYPNGSVIHDGIIYSTNKWYEVDDNETITRFGCPCIGRICLWKCCGANELYINKSCVPSDLEVINPFNPPVFKGQEPVDIRADQHFFYLYNKHLCDFRYRLDTGSRNDEAYMQGNGTLYELSDNRPQWHPPTTFCVDMLQTNVSLPARLVGMICLPDTDLEDDSDFLYIAYAVGLMLSVPFLLATFIVYAFISELRNLHGMCLMAYCAGLIVAYPLLAYLKINVGEVGVQKTGCLILAFIIYYAFQTSFFWLNVMCFDIWRTFSGYRGGSSSKRRDKRRFALYGLYAWGVPIVLTALTAAMEFSDDLPQSIIRPNFGVMRCWFVNWLSEMVYFFTPVLILVVCNVVLFSVTAHRIRSIRQETSILKGAESSRSDKLKRDKQRYALYLKLFVVMGVNWTVEVISFAAGGSNWYWILIDLSNIALGFFIFFIFVWKNKVRNLVRKKFAKWRGTSGEPRTTLMDSSSTSRWATRSSSAPTEVTRVSADEAAMRLKDIH